jgi:hypothetical protein
VFIGEYLCGMQRGLVGQTGQPPLTDALADLLFLPGYCAPRRAVADQRLRLFLRTSAVSAALSLSASLALAPALLLLRSV